MNFKVLYFLLGICLMSSVVCCNPFEAGNISISQNSYFSKIVKQTIGTQAVENLTPDQQQTERMIKMRHDRIIIMSFAAIIVLIIISINIAFYLIIRSRKKAMMKDKSNERF